MNTTTSKPLPPAFRKIIRDLVDGAVLLYRFGGYETYKEVDGKVRPCATRLAASDLKSFQVAVPELLPLLDGDTTARAFRLPAASRNAYADRLQQSIPLGDLLSDHEPQADAPMATRPRMTSN